MFCFPLGLGRNVPEFMRRFLHRLGKNCTSPSASYVCLHDPCKARSREIAVPTLDHDDALLSFAFIDACVGVRGCPNVPSSPCAYFVFKDCPQPASPQWSALVCAHRFATGSTRHSSALAEL